MLTNIDPADSWTPRHYTHLRHPSAGETALFLVRHGRTSANHRQVLQGSSDYPLDDTGLRQAALIANRVAQEPAIDAIVSSPLQRALVTARAIGDRLNIEPQVVPALTELDFGLYENRPFTDLLQEEPELAVRFQDLEDFDAGWPGGETRRSFYDRVWQAFTALLDDYHMHRVVVVAHGGVFGAFLAMVEGVSPNDIARYDIKNCSLTELRVTSDHTVVQLRNDVCHLDALADTLDATETER
ncbi:MAG: histidine phosphatase family protein [Chloroflexia bacterium]|nr:histidine phosphatase family protein [Chloroflexia bacterium]